METNDETVADILKEMRSIPFSWCYPEGIPQSMHDNAEVKKFADRIEAAIRRIRSRCYAALDGEYDCAHGYEIRNAFKGEVEDGK